MSDYENANWVNDWTLRMEEKYGPWVAIVDGSETSGNAMVYAYSWAFALCREQYGPEPGDWPDGPAAADIVRAQQWEAGEWPEWAVKPEEEVLIDD